MLIEAYNYFIVCYKHLLNVNNLLINAKQADLNKVFQLQITQTVSQRYKVQLVKLWNNCC